MNTPEQRTTTEVYDKSRQTFRHHFRVFSQTSLGGTVESVKTVHKKVSKILLAHFIFHHPFELTFWQWQFFQTGG